MAKGLGKGLSALLSDAETENHDHKIRLIAITKMEAGRYQPRRQFDQEALQELANSIQEKGVLQPLLLRKKEGSHEIPYEIIAGERRWRAAQMASLHEIPAIIRDFSDADSLEIGLIENLQRENLNPVEEAEAFDQLLQEFHYTQEQLAKILSKSRSYVANLLRLNQLPDEVKNYVREGLISAGHARALIGCENASQIAKEIIERSLSVRQVESLVKAQKTGKVKPKSPIQKKDPDTLLIENKITESLGLKVQIHNKKNGNTGSVSIAYHNLDQLDLILRKLEES